jgi:hypothetical protein
MKKRIAVASTAIRLSYHQDNYYQRNSLFLAFASTTGFVCTGLVAAAGAAATLIAGDLHHAVSAAASGDHQQTHEQSA